MVLFVINFYFFKILKFKFRIKELIKNFIILFQFLSLCQIDLKFTFQNRLDQPTFAISIFSKTILNN